MLPLALLRILRVLAKHDALFVLERVNASRWLQSAASLLGGGGAKSKSSKTKGERLAAALSELGPAYVKLGQAMSVRPDIVGSELAQGLRLLQDKMAHFPYSEVEASIEKSLGKPISKLFASFDKKPVAAASIAQVHKARLKDGSVVAVKVMRPGIRQAFARDIEVLRKIARALERRKHVRRLRPLEAVERFVEWTNMELDFRNEAAACNELTRCFEGSKTFSPPKLHWELCEKDVLVLEWIDGVRIDDVKGMRDFGLEPRKVLENSTRIFFQQVYTHGFFHGDIHPGNMFVTKDGVLRPVDFGIMGRLSLKKRELLAEMLVAFMVNDYEQAATILVKMGFFWDEELIPQFSQDLRMLIEPTIHKSDSGVSFAAMLQDIISLGEKYDMTFNSSLLLLDKSMLGAEGVGRAIDPSVNVWVLCEPEMEKWLLENRSLEARIAKGLERGLEYLSANLGSSADDEPAAGRTDSAPSASTPNPINPVLVFLLGCAASAIAFLGYLLAVAN